MSPERPPRDPRQLLVEMDARLKVREIREADRLRRAVDTRWWEPGLLAVLFVSGIGVVFTVLQLVPAGNELLYGFIVFWILLHVVTVILCLEFLSHKFRALRQMHARTTRVLDEHQAALKAIRDYLEAREEGQE
jgi:hypothetical protein